MCIIFHHHISFMELGHLLTRSSLTCPEVSSKAYHDSFCHMGSSCIIFYSNNLSLLRGFHCNLAQSLKFQHVDHIE